MDKKIDYYEKISEIYDLFDEAAVMTLGTAFNEDVSVRAVSVVVINGNFYFQTSASSEKAMQIRANPNVALCYKNVTIKGECEMLGHPFSKDNSVFIEMFAKRFESAYKKYSALEEEIVFEIKPKLIKVWNYEEGAPNLAIFDMKNQIYSIIPQGDK